MRSGEGPIHKTSLLLSNIGPEDCLTDRVDLGTTFGHVDARCQRLFADHNLGGHETSQLQSVYFSVWHQITVVAHA